MQPSPPELYRVGPFPPLRHETPTPLSATGRERSPGSSFYPQYLGASKQKPTTPWCFSRPVNRSPAPSEPGVIGAQSASPRPKQEGRESRERAHSSPFGGAFLAAARKAASEQPLPTSSRQLVPSRCTPCSVVFHRVRRVPHMTIHRSRAQSRKRRPSFARLKNYPGSPIAAGRAT